MVVLLSFFFADQSKSVHIYIYMGYKPEVVYYAHIYSYHTCIHSHTVYSHTHTGIHSCSHFDGKARRYLKAESGWTVNVKLGMWRYCVYNMRHVWKRRIEHSKLDSKSNLEWKRSLKLAGVT